MTGTSGDFYAFYIAKNGGILTESRAIVYVDNSSTIQNIALNENIDLSTNDYIELFVQRLTGSGNDNLVVFAENLSIN